MKIMTAPESTELLWKTDPDNWCSAVKGQQLDLALAGKAAWMSGIRRAEADTRATAHVVGRDLRGLVKVNPIAQWTDADVDEYIARHEVPPNQLLSPGYGSIARMPCTDQVADSADAQPRRRRGKSQPAVDRTRWSGALRPPRLVWLATH